jgi:hypothetical protein
VDKVSSFEFVFENGEKLSIPANLVESFGLFGVTWNVTQKYGEEKPDIYLTVNEYYIMISNEADEPYVDGSEPTASERLEVGDITEIRLYYSPTERYDTYYVQWDEDDEEFDKWQSLERFDDIFVLRR